MPEPFRPEAIKLTRLFTSRLEPKVSPDTDSLSTSGLCPRLWVLEMLFPKLESCLSVDSQSASWLLLPYSSLCSDSRALPITPFVNCLAEIVPICINQRRSPYVFLDLINIDARFERVDSSAMSNHPLLPLTLLRNFGLWTSKGLGALRI